MSLPRRQACVHFVIFIVRMVNARGTGTTRAVSCTMVLCFARHVCYNLEPRLV